MNFKKMSRIGEKVKEFDKPKSYISSFTKSFAVTHENRLKYVEIVILEL